MKFHVEFTKKKEDVCFCFLFFSELLSFVVAGARARVPLREGWSGRRPQAPATTNVISIWWQTCFTHAK